MADMATAHMTATQQQVVNKQQIIAVPKAQVAKVQKPDPQSITSVMHEQIKLRTDGINGLELNGISCCAGQVLATMLEGEYSLGGSKNQGQITAELAKHCQLLDAADKQRYENSSHNYLHSAKFFVQVLQAGLNVEKKTLFGEPVSKSFKALCRSIARADKELTLREQSQQQQQLQNRFRDSEVILNQYQNYSNHHKPYNNHPMPINTIQQQYQRQWHNTNAMPNKLNR